MNDLVFIESKKNPEPFTTSEVIAEYAEVKHHAIQQMISKHETALQAFGSVAFEMRACKHKTGASVQKIYHLTEPQATLLITFLKNTEPVVKFKTELVRQFYAMRQELINRQMQRMERKPIRRAMTDVIAETDQSKWAHKKYTDLVYKSTVGKNASQVRKERGAKPKSTASDFMTSDELSAVVKRENQVSVLLEIGMSYEQVKEILLNRRVVGTLGAHAVKTDAG
jgi:phage regulator Rha-like protein